MLSYTTITGLPFGGKHDGDGCAYFSSLSSKNKGDCYCDKKIYPFIKLKAGKRLNSVTFKRLMER